MQPSSMLAGFRLTQPSGLLPSKSSVQPSFFSCSLRSLSPAARSASARKIFMGNPPQSLRSGAALRLALVRAGDVEAAGGLLEEEDREAGAPGGVVQLVRRPPGPVGILVVQEVIGPLQVPVVGADAGRVVEHPGPLHPVEVVVMEPLRPAGI